MGFILDTVRVDALGAGGPVHFVIALDRETGQVIGRVSPPGALAETEAAVTASATAAFGPEYRPTPYSPTERGQAERAMRDAQKAIRPDISPYCPYQLGDLSMTKAVPGIPTDPDDILSEEGGVLIDLVRLAYIKGWTLSCLNNVLAHVFDGDLNPMTLKDAADIAYVEFGIKNTMLDPGAPPSPGPARALATGRHLPPGLAEKLALTPADG